MMRRTLTLMLATAVLAAVGAAPAHATIRDKFSFEESWTYAQHCGFDIEVSGSRTDMFMIREGKNSDAGAFPVLNRFRWSETWTNVDSGAFFIIRGHGTFNEVGATRVAGSVFEFRVVEAGQPFVVVDSDGNVVERNSGSVHMVYRFDTLGDNEPGGEFVEDVDFWIAGPHPSIFLDPCEYAVELIS